VKKRRRIHGDLFFLGRRKKEEKENFSHFSLRLARSF
jgi:hypothetical protein